MDFTIDLGTVVSNFLYLLLAYALAFPIGWDREAETRSAGLRTFPLVAVGACGYMIAARSVMESPDAHARVMYGIITGIGFIGGGAIVKDRRSVVGLATAASIWNTGAVGVSVAFNRLEIALVLVAMNFLTLRFVPRLKPMAKQSQKGNDD